MTTETSKNMDRRVSESTQDTEPQCSQEREGGKSAWLTVLGSFLVYYSSYGVLNSFGFFNDFYQVDFLKSTSPSTIAIIGTLQIALMNSLAAVSGALCDHYGVRYLYIGSGCGTVIALILLSLCKPGAFWQVFLSQGLLMGIAIAFGVQPALTVVGQHFSKQRALAMGIVCTASAAGGICFPIMFKSFLPMIGFRWALRVAALKVVGCYTVAVLISTSRNSGKKISLSLASLVDFKGFLDIKYSVLCIGAWIAQLGLFVPSFYIEPYCAVAFPGSAIKGYLLSVINAAGILGMVIGGLSGDRLGCLNVLCPAIMMTGLLYLSIWLFTTSMLSLISFTSLYGFFSGAYFALMPPVITQLSPDESIGARMGAFYSVVAVASLIGNPIAGALIRERSREGYQGVILYSGTAIILGSLVILGGRLLHGKDLRKKV
ncbi:major facilitator superfamily domain-containing protein [Massariosphaeria phaeospora]|uniref:Major facilitator superfamily domain-containing protein n=1 Tax=Massariosphaeria phaeospora TaxID=100035 RepID=A0A7C8MMR2_9PLEO|nr:major facilitator superfamily domain-containing protein [Massariosphaeria phaeospora]